MKPRPTLRGLTLATIAAASLLAAPTALAGDGDRSEVRVRGTCSGSAASRLRVRAEDGRIRIEFRIESSRSGGALWRLIVLHERRIVYRGTVRTTRGGGSPEVRRTVPDWYGTDAVTVRATGPGGETCLASATV